jgi:plastocyanin
MRSHQMIVAATAFVSIVAGCSGSAPTSTPSNAVAASPTSASAGQSPVPSSSVLVRHLAAAFTPSDTGGSVKWAPNSISAPAGETFQIAVKIDTDAVHNLWIVTPSQREAKDALVDQSGTAIFKSGDQGHGTKTYDIPALAAGTYYFVCTYHLASMTGTLTVH